MMQCGLAKLPQERHFSKSYLQIFFDLNSAISDSDSAISNLTLYKKPATAEVGNKAQIWGF